MQVLASGALPMRRAGRVFKLDAPAGEILGKAAPGRKVEFLRAFQLAQITVEARPFRQEAENTVLVEDVYLVLPDHVIDGRQLPPVTDEQRSEAGDPVSHEATRHRIGIANAKPAR